MANRILTLPACLGASIVKLAGTVGLWAVFSCTSLAHIFSFKNLLPKVLYNIYFIGFKNRSISLCWSLFLQAWSWVCRDIIR